jgi:hypothetical protein
MIQEKTNTWFLACLVEDMPANGGVCVKYKEMQIALFILRGWMNGMPRKMNVLTAIKWH